MPTAPLNLNYTQRIHYHVDPETHLTRNAAVARLSAQKRGLLATGGYVHHWNGGGLKHSGARVDHFAFIGIDAVVHSSGRVGKNSKVYGHVNIYGSVMENGIVRGNATVQEGSHVSDSAILSGNAVIHRGVWLGSAVRVGGDMVLQGRMQFNGHFSLLGDFTVANAGPDSWRIEIGTETIMTEKQLAHYVSMQ